MFWDPTDQANILNRQYESTFAREDITSIPVLEGQPYPSMPDITITEERVRKLLRKVNPHKARPDQIPAGILHDLADELAPYLTMVFQRSLDCGNVPEDWRNANVTAIFKKGDKFRASNYRPVSLTSLCCKLQEHVITSNTLNHLDDHQSLTDYQHGFHARRSCQTQLLTLVHELSQELDTGKQHDLIVLDFFK